MASGWIEKDGHGFKAVVRLPDGRRRAKRFVKRADAKNWLAEMTLTIDRGTFVDPKLGRVKFEAWATRFQESEHGLRPTTSSRDARAFRNYLVPHFGNMELGKIRQPVVQTWVDSMVEAGLAPATVQKYYQILTKTMTAAVDAGLLAQTPCRGIRLPKLEHQEMRFLDPHQVALLADKINPRYRALVLVGAYGGLRIGELAGLTTKRIDFAREAVDVRESVVEISGRIHFGTPKTRRGIRSVPLPGPVMGALEEHLRLYGSPDPDRFVFQGRDGGVLRPPAWRSRVFTPAAQAAKLAPLSPHDLRHTAIAIWIAAGVPVKEIADRAGHESVTTVLDRYGHLLPSSEREFRHRVGGLYVPPSSKIGSPHGDDEAAEAGDG